jgi:hypothetical protein
MKQGQLVVLFVTFMIAQARAKPQGTDLIPDRQ